MTFLAISKFSSFRAGLQGRRHAAQHRLRCPDRFGMIPAIVYISGAVSARLMSPPAHQVDPDREIQSPAISPQLVEISPQ